MIKHHLRELTKSFGSQLDPEKSGELRRTKTDMENNLTRIQKLIKNQDQSKKDGNRGPRTTGKETELEGLIEDFYNQYQSLYTLYGRLTGEYVKVAPRRLERGASVSSSSSDSEYFSSEEADGCNRTAESEHYNEIGNAKVNNPNQKLFSREREHYTLTNTNQFLKTRASAEGKEFEDQLTSKMKELESLRKQKRNLELQVESQAYEAKELSQKSTELQARVLELDLLLKESKKAVSVLQTELKNNENQAKSKVAELMVQINKLEQEAKSLRTQRSEMEEKITRNRTKALSQRKDLMEQLNIVQQRIDFVCNQNKKLEAQLALAERTSVEQSILKEKECFLVRIKDLELEVESRCSKQNYLEEQLRDRRDEINQLADEKKALQDRNHELEKAMKQRGEEISAILREHKSSKNGAMALTAQVDDLRLELDTLQDQKSKLELQYERSQKEYSESRAKMENLNVKLKTQVVDQEEKIKKQTETIDQINNKQTQIWSKKSKINRLFAEKKIEELHEKLENNIRLLHQRIHVAEQLNNENKASYKITKQRYEQENKMLNEKISCYEDELSTLKARATPSPVVLNGLELVALNGLDLAAGKIEEHREYVLSLISKMLTEVQFAKNWIKKKNDEMKQLQDNVDRLTELLSDKEEQELFLREKVWKLEANVSKEGGEKLNLMKALSQLEKKVGELESNLKEKDQELVGLAEKKREAIRQLCFLVEFHRERCDYLKDFITKTSVSDRTQA